MAQNLKPALAQDKMFTHNGKTLVLAFRKEASEDDVVNVFCGEIQPDGTAFDAQITLAFFLTQGKTPADFLTGEVFPLLNSQIANVYGPFSGGGTSPDPDWVEAAIAAIQAFIKSGCVFDPATGWKVNV